MLASVAGENFAIALAEKGAPKLPSASRRMSMQPVHAKSATYASFGTSSAMRLNANRVTGLSHAPEDAATTTRSQMVVSGGAPDPLVASQQSSSSKFFTE